MADGCAERTSDNRDRDAAGRGEDCYERDPVKVTVCWPGSCIRGSGTQHHQFTTKDIEFTILVVICGFAGAIQEESQVKKHHEHILRNE